MNLNFKVGKAPVREILMATHKAKSRGYFLRAHSHLWNEIIFVDYGRLSLKAGGSGLLLGPGDCVLIKGGLAHSFHGVAGKPFDFLNVCYRGLLPEELQGKALRAGRRSTEIMAKLKEEASSGEPFFKEMSCCLLGELIYSLLRDSRLRDAEPSPEPRNEVLHRSGIVRQALAMIERYYAKELPAKLLAAEAGVSVSYLRAVMREETGASAGEHIRRVRVEAAKKLLRESSLSIGEIREAAGYASLPFFFKVFKRHTGMTPRQYASTLGDPEEKV